MSVNYEVAMTLLREGKFDMMRKLKPDSSDLIDEIEGLMLEVGRLENENEDLRWRDGDWTYYTQN